MESVYLKTFVEVVRTGNISRAAENLCVTQPAVSKRLKFLEEQYGYPLLSRTNATFSLTDAGRIVLQKAEQLLDIEGELLAGLKTLTQQQRFSFSCTPTFGIAHLPEILKEFMLEYAEFSDLKFVFNMPGNIVKGMQEGLFDLALIEHCECFDLSEMTTVALPGDEMIFVSAPSLAIPPAGATFDDLIACSLYTRNEGCCSRTLLENNLRAIGRDLREFSRLVVYDDLHIIIRTVLDGDGISFLSRDLVSDYLKSERLVEHRIAGFRHQRMRTLVVSDCALKNNPSLNHFLQALFAHFNLSSPI